MIGKREADNISVGIASDDATLRDLESRAKAGRELLSYDPPGKKIIDGLISVGGFAELGQGTDRFRCSGFWPECFKSNWRCSRTTCIRKK